MAWRFLHQMVKDGGANDDYTKTLVEIYELDSIDDFDPFLFSCKKKNQLIATTGSDGKIYNYVIDSNNISKRQPMPGGKFQIEMTLNLRFLETWDELYAPWELPAFNFKTSQGICEESSTSFYPGYGDLLYGESSDAYPLVNTAGGLLEGSATLPLSQISFSYCISVVTFYKIQGWFWNLCGKINEDYCTICAMNFPPRTLKIDSINAEYCEMEKPGLIPVGDKWIGTTHFTQSEVADTTYFYYRIDVTMSSNSRTWNQSFLNVGTHIRQNGALCRIWRWEGKNGPEFGSYIDYKRSGGMYGEAVTEPLFLNSDGTGVAGLDSSGRQIGTYRYGSAYQPINFTSIGFPAQAPIKWKWN